MGRLEKTLLFLTFSSVAPEFSPWLHCSFPTLRKTSLISSIKSVSLSTICSLLYFFLYSVFNEHLPLGSSSSEVVGPSGLEPPTSCLSGTRSNHLSYEPVYGSSVTSTFGGDDGTRTHDPLLAKQVLSQLSYTPTPSRSGVASSSYLRFPFARPSKLNNN